MIKIILLVLLLGASVGSFLNVVIYRFPRKQSFILNRSQCPACKKYLNVFDLFPIVSWILLMGRCRYCNFSISKRYPFIELITSILFLLCSLSIGWQDIYSFDVFVLVSGWILASFLVVLSFIDIDNMILPNRITFSGSIVGLLLIIFYQGFISNVNKNIIYEHLFAYFLAFFGISIFSYFVKLLISKPGLGGGDAKLFAMAGIWLGLEGLEVTITLSFLISGIFVLFGFILKLIKRGEYIPFGPFICFSIFLVWLLGDQFWFKLLGDIFWWKYL